MLQSSKDRAKAIPVEESTEFRVPWRRFRRWYGQAPGMWLKIYAAGGWRSLKVTRERIAVRRPSRSGVADDQFSKFPIAVAIGR
jgi:hypothetical protein